MSWSPGGCHVDEFLLTCYFSISYWDIVAAFRAEPIGVDFCTLVSGINWSNRSDRGRHCLLAIDLRYYRRFAATFHDPEFRDPGPTLAKFATWAQPGKSSTELASSIAR